MTPLVSVLIPCFNAERYVRETLESALGQSWPNLEIIVVDDGSCDASASVVETFRDRGVRLIRQENKGAAAARNRAFSELAGDFIQFLDADDLLDPDKIALQVDRMRSSPTCVATAAWGRFYDAPDETAFIPETNWKDLDPLEWLLRSREAGEGMLFPAIWLVPRAIVEKAGPWNEAFSLGDDGEYFTRVVLSSDRVLFCSRARCLYRSGLRESLSRGKTPKAWHSMFAVLDACEGHVLARQDSERARRGFALSWQNLCHASYPYDPELAEKALQRARDMHSVTLRPGGGPTFQVLSRLVGWRAARRLQVASGRH